MLTFKSQRTIRPEQIMTKNNYDLPTNSSRKHHRCHDLLKHKRGTNDDKDTTQGLDLDGETDVVRCGDKAELAAPSVHLFVEP